MDQAFFIRAKKLLDQRQPARLDHAALLAAVSARQAATATARAANRAGSGRAQLSGEALVVLLLAGPEWREAARAQGGCFNRAVAARGVNSVETELTRIFTSGL